MANYIFVRDGGSKTTGYSYTGSSDIDTLTTEWLIANCYAPGVAPLGGANMKAQMLLDGDIVAFYDAKTDSSAVTDYPITLMSTLTPGSTVDGATFYIRSKSNDPDYCTFTTATAYASRQMLLRGNAGATAAGQLFAFSGMTFKHDSTADTGDGGFAKIDQKTVAATYTNCKFSAVGHIGQNLFNILGANIAVEQVITFSGCTFQNITHTNAVPSIIKNGNVGTGGVHMKLINCTMDNIAMTHSSTSPGIGIVSALDELTVSGGTYSNITYDGSAPQAGSAVVRGVFTETGAGRTVLISDVAFSSITYTGKVQAACVFVSGNGTTATINDCTATSIVADPLGDVAGDEGQGGFCLALGDGTNANEPEVTINRLTATGVESTFGALAYNSAGAEMIVNGVTARGCKGRLGLLYSGGGGDSSYSNVYIEDGEVSDTGIIYGRNNTSTGPDRAKTITVQSVTINGATLADWEYNDTTGQISAVTDAAFDFGHTQASVNALTVNMGECAYTSSFSYEVKCLVSNTGDCTINQDYCFNPVADSSANVIEDTGAGTGTISITNSGESTALNLEANGSPASNSALVGAGVKWWTGANPVGANGEPFSDFDTDIGAIQSTHGPFHPTNL